MKNGPSGVFAASVLAATVVFLPSKSLSDVLLYSTNSLAWANTGGQNSPVSYLVAFGACPVGAAGCHLSSVTFLDTAIFTPSETSQSVTISSGVTFQDVANAIDSDNFFYDVEMLVSNTIVPPDTFPSEGQGGGGILPGFPGAEITSIVVSIGPFVFQPYSYHSGGYVWVAQTSASDVIEPWGDAAFSREIPELTIDVYATTLVPQAPCVYDCPAPIPEPSTWAMMLLGLVGLGYPGYRRARAGRATPSSCMCGPALPPTNVRRPLSDCPDHASLCDRGGRGITVTRPPFFAQSCDADLMTRIARIVSPGAPNYVT